MTMANPDKTPLEHDGFVVRELLFDKVAELEAETVQLRRERETILNHLNLVLTYDKLPRAARVHLDQARAVLRGYPDKTPES